MRRLLFILAIGLGLFTAGIWRLSDGFSLSKMSAPLPHDARFEVHSPTTFQVRQLLSQPFYYMGKGSQSFVFESADKQYVLKFFRLSRYRLPAFQEALPLPPFLAEIQNKRIKEKRLKQDKLFASCKLAFEELNEECGLVYMHLNKTRSLHQEVTLYDNLGRPHSIAIDEYAFMIQRRGETLYSYLGKLIKKGETDEIQHAVLQLSALLDSRLEKGIADKDAEIHKNSGFLHGKPLFIDVGQFSKEPENHDRKKVMRKLLLWLEAKNVSTEALVHIIQKEGFFPESLNHVESAALVQ